MMKELKPESPREDRVYQRLRVPSALDKMIGRKSLCGTNRDFGGDAARLTALSASSRSLRIRCNTIRYYTARIRAQICAPLLIINRVHFVVHVIESEGEEAKERKRTYHLRGIIFIKYRYNAHSYGADFRNKRLAQTIALLFVNYLFFNTQIAFLKQTLRAIRAGSAWYAHL